MLKVTEGLPPSETREGQMRRMKAEVECAQLGAVEVYELCLRLMDENQRLAGENVLVMSALAEMYEQFVAGDAAAGEAEEVKTS